MRIALTTIVIALLVSTAAESAAAGSATRVDAEVFPTHALPGLPPAVRVTLTNVGSAAAEFPDAAVCLEVMPASGESFGCGTDDFPGYADYSNVRYEDGTREAKNFTLRPGESKTFVIGPRDSDFYHLPWIFSPGKYTLRVRFQHGNAPSDALSYTVDDPSGENRIVWQRMMEIIGGAAPNDRSASFLFDMNEGMQPTYRAHPTSVYAAIARLADEALLHLSFEEGVNLTKANLSTPLPDLVLDDLRLGLAETYKRWAWSLAKTDIDAAAAKASEGVSILRALASSRDPYAAVNAQAMLDSEGWTKADLIKMFSPKPLKPSHPRVDCVAISNDGTFTAWFGYDNPNEGLYGVPLGNRNHFEPAPENRGQPTWLNTIGSAERVFSVTATIGEKLVWVLEGTRATASANEGIRHCEDSPAQGH